MEQSESGLFKYGKPAGTRLIVQADEAADKTQAGIIIPDTAKERPQIGTVLAIGDGVTEQGIEAGSRIVFGKHAGVQLQIAGKMFYVMQEREIFMVLNQEELDKAELENMLASEQTAAVVKELELPEVFTLKSDALSYAVGGDITISWNCKSIKGDAVIYVKRNNGDILLELKRKQQKGENSTLFIANRNWIPEIEVIVELTETYGAGHKESEIKRTASLKLEIHK